MEYFVRISEIQIAKQPAVLKTVVGSCIAVCLWDPDNGRGGMAHIFMPEKNGDVDAPVGKYADTGIPALINLMVQQGANLSRLQAVCAGGASMFLQSSDNGSSIGHRNLLAVRRTLSEMNVRITSEAVGGTMGRKIAMNCEDGSITITTLQKRVQWTN